jgi:anion-transporting  ArsA/GET3 family ATPase
MRAIVAEVAARDDVTRAFAGERDVAPFTERELPGGLHHISIEPELAMQEYLVDQLPVRALADVLVASRVFTYLTAATPGLRELLTIGKVWELAQPDRRTPGAHPYDVVVLDAPATGHGVAILSAPRTFAEAARVGPVARQGGKIHTMLADSDRTGVVAVSLPEEMPVNETLALRESLREQMGLDLDLVVVLGGGLGLGFGLSLLRLGLVDRLEPRKQLELGLGALLGSEVGVGERPLLHRPVYRRGGASP